MPPALCFGVLTDWSIYLGRDRSRRNALEGRGSSQPTADKAANTAAADRLTRAAAADGAQLIVLRRRGPSRARRGSAPAPSRWTGPLSVGARAGARAAGRPARRSLVERRAGSELLANTSVHVGPEGTVRAAYRKLHMFDVEVEGRASASPPSPSPAGDRAERDRRRRRAGHGDLLRPALPELFGALAARGARVVVLPSAFTLPTTRDHGRSVRARAIENKVF